MAEMILGIDTSVDVRAGVAADFEVVSRAGNPDRRGHVEFCAQVVATALDAANCRGAEVTQIRVGLGPGPFTGLRVGIATAQSLAFAWGIEWTGVCSLDVLARQVVSAWDNPQTDFVVATDARRQEVYWARYAATGERLFGPEVAAPHTVAELPTTGPGATLYPQVFGARYFPGPDTVDAGLLAAGEYRAAGRQPLYLRRPDAAVAVSRKSALPALLRPRKRS